MGASRNREIVVELERIQLVRKRARTHLMYCDVCRRESDFVSVPDAARVFDVCEIDMDRFVKNNGWHSQTISRCVFICTVSLLADLMMKKKRASLRLVG